MRTTIGLGLGLVVAGLMSASFAAGCGNGDDDDTSDGGISKDGGAPPATGTDSGAASDSSAGGSVTAGSLLFGAGGTDNNGVSAGYQVVGVFVTGSSSGTGGAGACGAIVGNCQFCGGDRDGGTVQTDITQESAGTLTIDDGTTPLAMLTYDSTAEIYQIDSADDDQSTSVWSVGDTLNVTASGAAFPAFSGSIKAPATFTGVTPAFADLSPLTVPASGLTVSWTPAGDSSQVRLLLGVLADRNSTSVSCTAADSTGKIVVPAALLAQLASSGDSGGTAGLTRTLTSTSTTASGASVSFTAQSLQYTGTFNFSQ